MEKASFRRVAGSLRFIQTLQCVAPGWFACPVRSLLR